MQPKEWMMKVLVRSFRVISMFALFAVLCFTAVAQEIVLQRLNISKATSVREVDPGILEIIVALQDGSKASLRMNIFTARNLGVQLARFGM
jgi:hypothetical protein